MKAAWGAALKQTAVVLWVLPGVETVNGVQLLVQNASMTCVHRDLDTLRGGKVGLWLNVVAGLWWISANKAQLLV